MRECILGFTCCSPSLTNLSFTIPCACDVRVVEFDHFDFAATKSGGCTDGQNEETSISLNELEETGVYSALFFGITMSRKLLLTEIHSFMNSSGAPRSSGEPKAHTRRRA